MAKAAYAPRVTLVEHYTDSYFRFRVERPAGFRFQSGQFVMVGLEVEGTPVMRAYSVASAPWDDELEFYSIVIPDGRLTSRLRNIAPGDHVLLSGKPVGSLTLRSLARGGRRLFLLSTGTGVAPFISIVRDPETYERFEHVFLTQTCRLEADLRYGYDRAAEAKTCPLVGEEAQSALRFFGSTTREPSAYEGRITTLIENGALFDGLGVPALDAATDRVMICGSKEMLRDTRAVLAARGLSPGSGTEAAGYTWEKAFAG